MKKILFFSIALLAFCTPVHAISLKKQAIIMERVLKGLAKSQTYLWNLANTLRERVNYLERELKKTSNMTFMQRR